MIAPTFITNVDLAQENGVVAITGLEASVTQLVATSFLSGPQGPPGVDGPAGAGILAGGAIGQILGKLSPADFNSTWYDYFLQLAANPDALIIGAITRNSDDAVTSAAVEWPDGTPGVFTATDLSTAFPGAVDGYTITYGSPVQATYTQAPVTRNANGAVVTRPAIGVS